VIAVEECTRVPRAFSDENSLSSSQSHRVDRRKQEENIGSAANRPAAADASLEEIWKAVEACRVCIENSRQLLKSISSRK
jgi:hypothetical protein